VAVLPDVPAIQRTFHYLVPPEWDEAVRTGTRVRVVLHGRRVGGWVVPDGEPPPGAVALRPLSALSGWGPPPGVIELARWAAWRWAGPVSSFLRTASPERNVHTLPEAPALPTGGAGPLAGGPIGAGADGRSEAGALHALATDALAHDTGPTLLRIPPATDLLPLVEALAGAPVAGRSGTLLVLVPNLGWAERLRARLVRRGVPVAAGWDEEAAGWPVVVGSRAAAWSPAPRLRAALVLDAHDEVYREERSPTANAWEVVAERARRDGAPCVLVSPCPTVVQVQRSRLRPLDRPVERRGWPRFVVVDRRGADPRTGLLSEELVAAARRHLAAADPVVCVLNRTGRARLLACASCGGLVRCTGCGGSMALQGNDLRCRACAAERPAVCASCGSTRLRILRPGVSRLREELEALLRVPVAEVSGPAGRDPAHGGAGEPAAPVLIGTEAVLHRVRRAGLVAFLDVDQHLLAPRFTAGEALLALLARAGRLVGGRGEGPAGQTGGRAAAPAPAVLVQTRMPDHEVLRAAVHGDPDILTAGELPLRRQLGLPPARALALVSGEGAKAYAAEVAGAGAVVASELGTDRWLLRAPTTAALCDALAAAKRPRGRLRVEVDPTQV
jgi:primosomal protein N' (replication factor Y)